MRMTVTLVLAALALMSVGCIGCTRDKAPMPTPSAPVKAKTPSFVPPTAEQAYRLQDDCSRHGEKILRENIIGPVLTQEQVSRYNATTNRCYVRLDVHAKDLSEWDKYDNSTYLWNGQTKELLAHFTHKPNGKTAYLGFGCGDIACVEDKVAACMSGKECEP